MCIVAAVRRTLEGRRRLLCMCVCVCVHNITCMCVHYYLCAYSEWGLHMCVGVMCSVVCM